MPIVDILANNSFVSAPAAAPAAVSTATAWKQLLSANRISAEDEDPSSLNPTITDTGGEIVFTGDIYGATPLPNRCCFFYWYAVDPDTDSTVTWSDGDFVAVEYWVDFGTEMPAAANEAFWCGLKEDGVTDASLSGLYITTGPTARIGAGTWSAVSNQTTTWNSDDILFSSCQCLADASSSAIILDGSHTVQFDDAASPKRVLDTARNTGYSVVSGDLRLGVGFSGNCDVAIYYRFIKTPVDPT